MKIKKWEVDRRHFLKCSMGGAGAMLSLPFLEAMLPSIKRAEADEADLYRRFIALPWGMGGVTRAEFGRTDHFFPPEVFDNRNSARIRRGSEYTLSDTLTPLAGLRSQLRLYSGLCYYGNEKGEEDQGHDAEMSHFLTNLRHLPNWNSVLDDAALPASIYKGKSMDIIISEYFQSQMSGRTAIDSIHLASERNSIVHGCMTYRRADQPIHPENDLQKAFTKLFAGVNVDDTAAVEQARVTRKRLLLDFVRGDIRSLMNKLGREDRKRMDDYLGEVETLDLSIQRATQTSNGCTIPGTPPTMVNYDR
ncbi:MAG: DUF1552 domain-containing protein, partial [Proteobacteria bacterium]